MPNSKTKTDDKNIGICGSHKSSPTLCKLKAGTELKTEIVLARLHWKNSGSVYTSCTLNAFEIQICCGLKISLLTGLGGIQQVSVLSKGSYLDKGPRNCEFGVSSQGSIQSSGWSCLYWKNGVSLHCSTVAKGQQVLRLCSTAAGRWPELSGSPSDPLEHCSLCLWLSPGFPLYRRMSPVDGPSLVRWAADRIPGSWWEANCSACLFIEEKDFHSGNPSLLEWYFFITHFYWNPVCCLGVESLFLG